MKLCSRRMGRALCVTLFAALVAFSGIAGAETETVTVSQAVDLAKTNSISLQIAQLELDNARIAYDKALVTSQTELELNNATAAWDGAQRAYRSAETDVLKATLEAYVAVQEAEVKLKVEEKSVSLAAQSFEKTKLLLAKGQAGSLEGLQAERNYMAATNSLDLATNAYSSAEENFQQLVGRKVLPAAPSAPMFKTPELSISLEDAIATALANSSSVKSLQNALAAAQLNRELDLATGISKLDDRKSQNDLAIAQLRLDNAKLSLVKSVTTQYNSVVQGKQSLAIAAAGLDIAQKQFEINQKQVEAGIKTASDLVSAEIAWMNAQSSYYNSLGLGSSGYLGKWLTLQGTLGNEINLSEVITDANL